jgi:hypothetical protein
MYKEISNTFAVFARLLLTILLLTVMGLFILDEQSQLNKLYIWYDNIFAITCFNSVP